MDKLKNTPEFKSAVIEMVNLKLAEKQRKIAKAKEFSFYEGKIDELLNNHKAAIQKSQFLNNSLEKLNAANDYGSPKNMQIMKPNQQNIGEHNKRERSQKVMVKSKPRISKRSTTINNIEDEIN